MKIKEMRKKKKNLENSSPLFLLTDRQKVIALIWYLYFYADNTEVSDPRGTFTWTMFANYNVYQACACDDLIYRMLI